MSYLRQYEVNTEKTRGTVYVTDDGDMAAKQRKLLLQSLKGLPTVTKSGKVVHLYANIGRLEISLISAARPRI